MAKQGQSLFGCIFTGALIVATPALILGGHHFDAPKASAAGWILFGILVSLAVFSRRRRYRQPTFDEFLKRCRRHVKLTDKDDIRLFELIADCRMHDSEYIEWQARRASWLPSYPATEKQIALLSALNYSGPPPRSVIAASDLIDELKVLAEFRKEKADRRLQKEKLEKAKEIRKARAAIVEEERKHKAEAKRQAMLARLRATPPRPSVSPKVRIKWLLEFQQLWNDGVADDETIARPNAEHLHAWLIAHRTIDMMHEDLIDSLLQLLKQQGTRLALSTEIFDQATSCATNLGGKVVNI